MSKALNIVFGIGIAVVIYVLILLGIQAFYPEPRYEDFCNQTYYADPIVDFAKCTDDMTVKECRATMGDTTQKEQQECQKNWDAANKTYNKTFFILACILGVIVLVASFFLWNITNISVGVACAGIVLIAFAFIRSWQSTDDRLKFFVGLVVAAIVVTLTLLLNKKMAKKTAKK